MAKAKLSMERNNYDREKDIKRVAKILLDGSYN